MKKTIFVVLVCVLTSLFTSAYAGVNYFTDRTVTSPISIQKLTYTINLGDITTLGQDEIAKTLDTLFKDVEELAVAEEKKKVEYAVTVIVGLEIDGLKSKVKIDVTGPCYELAPKAKKIVKEMLKELSME